MSSLTGGGVKPTVNSLTVAQSRSNSHFSANCFVIAIMPYFLNGHNIIGEKQIEVQITEDFKIEIAMLLVLFHLIEIWPVFGFLLND